MKFALKAALILFSGLIVMGTFPVEEASAQGPIIRGLRNRLNDGKPLLPFVADIEESIKPQPPNRLSPAAKAAKQPTPAKKAPSSADRSPSRTPTPATRPEAERGPTPAGKEPKAKYPPIKLQSPGEKMDEPPTQDKAAAGFGMSIQKYGEGFIVGQVDPRGNAAAAGVRRGDVIENIGGAPIKVLEEYEAIAKAMRGGDRVEFEVSRRGAKPEKLIVQFGQPAPTEEADENEIQIAPSYEPTPAAPTRRTMSDRYEPKSGSESLRSIYDRPDKPSSILAPTPAPTPANRVESLELDLPALDGGR